MNNIVDKNINEKSIDVIGLGNSLLDLLVEVDDFFLEKINFEKGNMHLVDEDDLNNILSELNDFKITVCAGGSCANTIAGVTYCLSPADALMYSL